MHVSTDGSRCSPSPAAQTLHTVDEFRQEQFMLENARYLNVPRPVASFVDKNIVLALKSNLRCRNEDGDVDLSLVERACKFITSELDILFNVELCSQFPKLQLGKDDKEPLKYKSFVRALIGKDRFYVEVFEIIRASGSFEIVEQNPDDLTFFEVNEEMAKHAVSFIRKFGGFSAALGFKLVVLGRINAGKTALMQRFVNGSFNDRTEPTIGLDFLTKDFHDGDQVRKVKLWDTAGQERFNSTTSIYLKGALGAVIVYDATSSDDVTEFIALAKKHQIQDIVVFGNKTDLLEVQDLPAPHWLSGVNGMRKSNGVVYFTGSAKTGSMVNEAFERLIQMGLDRHCQEKNPSATGDDPFRLTLSPTTQESDQTPPRRKACCG
jgi:small GTP-binding protein